MQNVRQVGVRPAGTAAGQQLQGYQGIPILGPGGAVQFGIPVQPATAVRPQVNVLFTYTCWVGTSNSLTKIPWI